MHNYNENVPTTTNLKAQNNTSHHATDLKGNIHINLKMAMRGDVQNEIKDVLFLGRNIKNG